MNRDIDAVSCSGKTYSHYQEGQIVDTNADTNPGDEWRITVDERFHKKPKNCTLAGSGGR